MNLSEFTEPVSPFDGLKPYGTPIDEKVKAADKSIEVGNLSPMEGLIEKKKMPELKERFERVMALKNFDVNNVEAGREYIEAYVMFFKFAEGEEEHHWAAEGHGAASAHGLTCTRPGACGTTARAAGTRPWPPTWRPGNRGFLRFPGSGLAAQIDLGKLASIDQ